MEKALKLYNSKGAFPSAESQIEMLGFNYDAKRMGGAPIVTGAVMYSSCLDSVWSDDVYVEFNGEKYYLKQTPTSSFSNSDARYKHECEFVSERIKLNNVYFFDTVVGNPQGYDKPVSNSSVFSFFGNIREFAKRLNASLQYSKLQTKNEDGTYSGYVVVVDDDVDNEEKLLSFSNVPFSIALQESYNQFEIPYYFVGKEIHFGYWQEVIEEPFRYGVDKELLSITKTNANQKVITRCTGTGGAENIPYYYPNAHPQGEVVPLYNKIQDVVSVDDEALFVKNVLLTDDLKYTSYVRTIIAGKRVEYYEISNFKEYKNTVTNKTLINGNVLTEDNWFLAPYKNWTDAEKEKYSTAALGNYATYDDNVQSLLFNKDRNAVAFRITFDKEYFIPNPTTDGEVAEKTFKLTITGIPNARLFEDSIGFFVRSGIDGYNARESGYSINKQDGTLIWSGTFAILESWFTDDLNYDKAIYLVLKTKNTLSQAQSFKLKFDIEFNEPKTIYTWEKNGKNYVDLKNLGLSNVPAPQIGDEITFKQVSYVQPMPNLMPPVYWKSNGTERFYNAVNYPFVYTEGYELNADAGEYVKNGEVLNDGYISAATGRTYRFETPYSDSKRVEHIVEFPDIKPTIEGMTNNAWQPINAFLEFAYDEDDSDAIDKDGNHIHPYFYAKLPKFDSFNLFTHANEKGEVTFSMKSGNCGACNFVLGVNPESGKNDLQVNEKGELLFENGVAKRGLPQDQQNDTKNNEVWVALKKDNSTFGTIMPSAQHKYYPAAGDTFVLLNITMPIEYVEAAENRLKEEIIKYMYENNTEKFSFYIKFSRIYLAENPQILNTLNENAFIKVEYNGVEHPLYVNSFAYKMTAGESLPEITVELTETLSTSMNAIQSAVSQVRTDVLDRMQKMDIAAMVASKFLSKNDEDYAKQKITFNRGLSVGTQDSEVANIDQMGNAILESATLKQYISSPNFRDGFSGEGFKMWLDENGLSHLTVDTLTARQRMVIYEMLISKIRSVNGELWVSAANGTIAKVVERDNDFEITLEDDNMFVVGDYMRCQVFSGAESRSYWVEISGVDGGRLYVGKSEFEDVLPQEGDDIILCGSKKNGRQNAIHISSTDDGQPRIDILSGISTKSLDGCLSTRLGNLNGIKDSHFEEAGVKVQGDGLYSDNAFLKGDFILKNRGKSVETEFSIQEGLIKSNIAQTQSVADQGGYLYNSSFTKGLDGWITSNVINAVYDGINGLILDNNNITSNGVTLYNSPEFEDLFILNVKNGWIKQYNWQFVNKPNFDYTKQYPLKLSLNVRANSTSILFACVNAGSPYKGYAISVVGEASGETEDGIRYYGFRTGDTKGSTYCLKIDFHNEFNKQTTIVLDCNNEKWCDIEYFGQWREFNILEDGIYGDDSDYETLDDFTYLLYSVALQGVIPPNGEFKQLTAEYSWNGLGNFFMYANGDIDIYGIKLYTDEMEVTHQTLFEQSDRLVSISAAMYGGDKTLLKKSGLLVQPNESGLYAFDNNGNSAKIGVSVSDEGKSKVLISGDEVQLTGNLTTDGNFKVRADGSIEAKNGVFRGIILNQPLEITDDNFDEHFVKASKGAFWYLKESSMTNCVLYNVANTPNIANAIILPMINNSNTDYNINFVRGMIGQRFTVYNYSVANISVHRPSEVGNSTQLDRIYANKFSSYKCVLGTLDGYEYIYWEKEIDNGNIKTT